MKRFGLALLVTAFLALMAGVVSADDPGITVHFNGKRIFFDAPPVVENGTTLVPFRAIFEKVGAEVAFDSATQKVTAKRGNLTIEMTIDSSTASVNGQSVSLAVPPKVVSRRTLVPLRFVGEALGAKVNWDPVRQRIDIDDPVYPARGGQVTLGMISAPAGIFNPHISSNVYDGYVNDLVFDALWNADDSLTPFPSMASHWSVSPDSKTITFYLKDGIKWHDGRPVTVEDLHFSFMAFMHPNYKGPRAGGWDALKGFDDYVAGRASTVAGLKIVGSNALSFELHTVHAPFFLNNTGHAIVPKHLYENVPVEDWGTAKDPNNARPIGSGPFKFVQHVEGQFVVFDRNADYHDGAPYLDRVIWRVVPQETVLAHLETNDLQYAEQVPLKDLDAARRLSHLDVISFPDLTFQYMGLNTQRAPLNDVRVRQAVHYAIDRNEIIEGIMEGHAGEMITPMHPLTWPYNPNVERYDYDPTKAKALLDQAGWAVGSDGIRVKDGKRMKLHLVYPTGNVQRMAAGPVIQQMLRDVGIEVELELTEFATLQEKTDAPDYDFDLYFLGFRLGLEPDPSDVHGKAAIKKGGFNRNQWTTEKSEELLKKATSTMDLEERKQFYYEWQVHFMEEAPVYHFYAPNTNLAVAKNIGNFKQRPINSVWNIHEWFIQK